ncbi:hypothetical protein BLNAU_18647 [Blattamonas nauphoetae]|uniref:Right handed beta helix domain-containing protein n=1 Tax=Blattamonas nauphoetae TaxID=2049346 RepID=A0ABQ9X3P7_9EUKA|nr:hypothetical protein BLNAU_18647 [Blattamonas nauphoetae]
MIKALWLLILTIASHGATPLSEIMDHHLSRDNRNKQQSDDVLHLSPGVFELLDYPVVSTMLKLEGNISTISHANPERQALMNELENDHSHHLNHFVKGHTDASNSLFLFDNSTVSLNKLIFDCGCDGIALAKVRSSEVVVSSSQIVSNSKQTAFVVGTGLDEVGSSINVFDSSHISSSSIVLLPLVSTSTSPPTSPRDSSSMHTPHSDDVSPFLSVSVDGLVLSDVELILGTGPLLDFGLFSHHSTRSDENSFGEISTLLVGSVLRNVTSRGCSRSELVLPKGLSQKLVATSVTLSTSHLYGTGCLDINTFGSVGCVNTSFSHCSSNAEDSFTRKHFKQGERYVFEKNLDITLTFHLCTFYSMTSDIYGACISLVATNFLTITECSFNNTKGKYGGAIYANCRDVAKGISSVSLSLFVNCEAQTAGALYCADSKELSINKCFFKDTTTTVSQSVGGAVLIAHTNTATITNCVFMDGTACDDRGRGGAIRIVTTWLSLTSAQFIRNSAPFGSDLDVAADSGDTPSELLTLVSDCHTDQPDTSVYFRDEGIQTGIFEQFGTTTTITNLEIIFSGSDFQGAIEVETADAVQGTMLLLLDNSETYTPSSVDSPPATFRVVVVDFPDPSTTGISEVMSFDDLERLQSSCTYSLIAASISATPLDIPSPPPSIFTFDAPRVRTILCQPGTIGEMLISLEGHKLTVGDYTIHFEGSPSLSLTVTFTENQEGSPNQFSSTGSVGPGGRDERFIFGETYNVDMITFNDVPVLMETVGLSVVLPPFETQFEIEVNKAEGGDGRCRGEDNSCGSLDAAFEAVMKIAMKQTTLKLVRSGTLSNAHSISDECEVLLINGDQIRPSLIVPETFSSNPLVVLSVLKASLTLIDVDALIHSVSLSLKLVRVSSGSFEFSNGVISYKPASTANSAIGNADSDLCSWTTGTIELVNSTAMFESCTLTNLAQGAIIQKGGKVTLKEVSFQSNGPRSPDFPSARRNVMCSENGKLEVGGPKGDGGNHDLPGFGISSEGCSVSGTAATLSNPSLDISKSKITHDKKAGTFELELVGSGFLPCGLKVEVYTDSEDDNSGESSVLDVDTDTAVLFNETRIEFIVTPNDVANLSKKAEWKVRLLNGNSSIGTEHLVLQGKPRSMVWLIPVIIVVVVVIAAVIVALILIWRCRSKKPAEKKEDAIENADDTTTTEMKEAVSDQPDTEREGEPVIDVSDSKM